MTAHPFKSFLLDLLHQAQISQNAFFQELSPAELDTIGTPSYWSAKDHVAHLAFWRQRLVLRLKALLRQEPQPKTEDFEKLNPIVFEENRYRSWPDILSESDQVYAELIKLTEQLSEEDLTAFNRFDWIPEGQPLYTSFMGNCYEHTQEHLAQYLLDRDDLPQATHIRESWANRVIEAEVPDPLKGGVLYNLACFYTLHNQLEKATTALQQALTLYPHLKEWSLSDPDLIALRDQSA